LLYLFIPLYAGVLFQLRKLKIGGLFLSGIIGASPLLLAVYGKNSSGIIHYFIIIVIMLNIAVAKKWFGVNRILGFLCVWGSILVTLMASFFLRSSLLTGYQESRFLALMTLGNSDELYLPNMVEKALVNSKMFGRDISMVKNLPVVDNDFVLVFIFNVFGIFVGILILGLLLALIIKAYKIAKKQRSYLGFMVGIACLLSLSVQILFYCISNLVFSSIISIAPQQNLPFLSSGGSNVIYSYALVGLLLSVHRNSEIISDRLIQSRRKRLFRRKEVV
jgi:cell division protein FtsW (lipid II flippase)